MCTCTSAQLRLGARRARRPCRIPYRLLAADGALSRRRELPRAASSWRRPMRRALGDRLERERRAQRRPGARRSQPDAVPCRYRFQPAADEVPAGAGASSPSRRSSRRAGERSKRPGSDWPSMMVLCSCRSSRDAVAEEKRKASQLAKRLGWAMLPRREKRAKCASKCAELRA